MAATEKETINESQGTEIPVPCSVCNGKPFHKVLASIDKTGQDDTDGFDFQWDATYQIIKCQGCRTICFRRATSNSEDFEPINQNEWTWRITETIYPPRLEGRNGLGDSDVYLPAKIRRIYAETLQALSTDCPVLAGIGLRALVETICVEKCADGKNLFEQIDDLVVKKILTPAGAEILHKIRTLGNSAAHEVKPHSEKQLGLAMEVIEHVLTDVYILPRKIEAEFKDD